jgi:hypothetical protein
MRRRHTKKDYRKADEKTVPSVADPAPVDQDWLRMMEAKNETVRLEREYSRHIAIMAWLGILAIILTLGMVLRSDVPSPFIGLLEALVIAMMFLVGFKRD